MSTMSQRSRHSSKSPETSQNPKNQLTISKHFKSFSSSAWISSNQFFYRQKHNLDSKTCSITFFPHKIIVKPIESSLLILIYRSSLSWHFQKILKTLKRFWTFSFYSEDSRIILEHLNGSCDSQNESQSWKVTVTPKLNSIFPQKLPRFFLINEIADLPVTETIQKFCDHFRRKALASMTHKSK
jgi:hypothetical protein